MATRKGRYPEQMSIRVEPETKRVYKKAAGVMGSKPSVLGRQALNDGVEILQGVIDLAEAEAQARREAEAKARREAQARREAEAEALRIAKEAERMVAQAAGVRPTPEPRSSSKKKNQQPKKLTMKPGQVALL